MLKRVVRVGLGALLLSAGCGDGSKTKAQGESVESCGCPVDWELDNSALCVADATSYSPPIIFSSHLDERGRLACDETVGFPQPVSAEPWSAQRITSRCSGKGTLTLRVRQGRAARASADDCILSEQSLEFDYVQRSRALALPPAAAWSAQSEACARAFASEGGYLELRIESENLGCGEPDAKVNYVDICPAGCAEDPARAGCEACEDAPEANRL